MYRIALLPLSLSACVPAVTHREIDGDTPGIAELVDGNDAFAFDIEHVVAADGGNAFFSPLSMSGALAMTYAGAAGETATQMHDVLHVGLSDDEYHPLFGALLEDLDQDKLAPYQLDIANKLFGQAGYDWRDDFVDLTDTAYAAPLEPVDFDGDAEAVRKEINGWVAGETHDRIQDLFAPGSLTSDTAMVLANAIYFKGSWENGFDASLTKDADFTLLAGAPVPVSMMTLPSTDLQVGALDGARIVELPYKGGDLAMDLIVPDAVDGLPAVEAGLDGEAFQAALDGLGTSEIEVRMPKVELTWQRELNADLIGLGMTDAFDPSLADFSGMIQGDPGLHVDLVVHQAYVAIDEEGTEAAAATAVATNDYAMVELPEPIVADHPYLFVIRDLLTGSVLFVGRIEDPS